jgi:hypothetical protein
MKLMPNSEEPLWIDSLEHEIPPELADKTIGRYFRLSGFLKMLETSKLHFRKISDFEDKAEGIPQYPETIHSLGQSEKYVNTDYANYRIESILQTIENYYASCWTLNDNESYLMWKNYTSFDEGILILTTVKQLLMSLDLKCFEEYADIGTGEFVKCEYCFFGEVDYNYQKKVKTDHIKAFGKSSYFSDENEFRVVIYRHPTIDNSIIYRHIKDFSFINSITSSPKATKEFTNLLRRIAFDHHLPVSIIKESKIKQNSRDIFTEFLSENPKNK